MSTIEKIPGLKCPGHQYRNDDYYFTYERIGSMEATDSTRCLRCGQIKFMHKQQR